MERVLLHHIAEHTELRYYLEEQFVELGLGIVVDKSKYKYYYAKMICILNINIYIYLLYTMVIAQP